MSVFRGARWTVGCARRPCLGVLTVDATSETLRGALAISVNGEPREMQIGASLADLVGVIGLAGRKIAIAVNRDVVPRAGYGSRILHAGDRVEILEAVGGG